MHGDSYATDVEEDDVDECHRNDLLPNDVARTLEVDKHNNNQCEAAFDISAVQSREKNDHQKKRVRARKQWPAKENQSVGNTGSNCCALS